jgi:cell wall-associated NlpC family hydrolase
VNAVHGRAGSRQTIVLAVGLLAAAALLGALAPLAAAQTYSDVPSGHWARGAIDFVTDRGPTDAKLLDDYADAFKPERAITRAQLARALVVASGHYGELVEPVDIPDMPPGLHPYYWDVQLALHHGFMGLTTRAGELGFHPDAPVPAAKAEAALVRWLQQKYTSADWTLLGRLGAGTWEPVPGWKPAVPSYFAAVVASRQLQLRFNHSSGGDGHEVVPGKAIDRAEVAYMFRRAFKVAGTWQLSGLARYADVTFPELSERQKQVAAFAFKYVGYPYIWGGEWPTRSSPYGAQKAGGFDCSGFTFYVMHLHFGYPVRGRGAGDQARYAKPRIKRTSLKGGDLVFFGYQGPSSPIGSIYHAGLYLGRGWFIHSTGSSDGVTLCYLNDGGYWQSHFAWGRRLLSASELALP